MGPKGVLLVSMLLLGVGLAGCVSKSDSDDVPVDGQTVDAKVDPALNLDASKLQLQRGDSVDAPEWNVGDQFGQHIFDDPSDPAGFHIESMVIAETSSSYTIGTSDAELARRHTYWDLPFLGEFTKSQLGTTAYGIDWDFMFQFPLEDNKTWTRQLELPDPSFYWNNLYEATFTVSYDAAIDSFSGKYPGFRIEATTGDSLLFEYAYIPAIRWYDQFVWYDLATEDVSDWRLKAISMGTSTNWTGTYHHNSIVQKVEIFNIFCPFLADEWCQPRNTHATFELQGEGTHLFGMLVTGAWGGHVRVALRPPEGDARLFEFTNTNPPSGPEAFEENPPIEEITKRHWIDEPATRGEWGFENAGAGVFWGGFLNVVEIEEVEGTL